MSYVNVFCLTRPGIEPPISRVPGERYSDGYNSTDNIYCSIVLEIDFLILESLHVILFQIFYFTKYKKKPCKAELGFNNWIHNNFKR